MNNLEQIFDHYGSDKGSILEGHKYATGYEELISKNIENLLEIEYRQVLLDRLTYSPEVN